MDQKWWSKISGSIRARVQLKCTLNFSFSVGSRIHIFFYSTHNSWFANFFSVMDSKWNHTEKWNHWEMKSQKPLHTQCVRKCDTPYNFNCFWVVLYQCYSIEQYLTVCNMTYTEWDDELIQQINESCLYLPSSSPRFRALEKSWFEWHMLRLL